MYTVRKCVKCKQEKRRHDYDSREWAKTRFQRQCRACKSGAPAAGEDASAGAAAAGGVPAGEDAAAAGRMSGPPPMGGPDGASFGTSPARGQAAAAAATVGAAGGEPVATVASAAAAGTPAATWRTDAAISTPCRANMMSPSAVFHALHSGALLSGSPVLSVGQRDLQSVRVLSAGVFDDIEGSSTPGAPGSQLPPVSLPARGLQRGQLPAEAQTPDAGAALGSVAADSSFLARSSQASGKTKERGGASDKALKPQRGTLVKDGQGGWVVQSADDVDWRSGAPDLTDTHNVFYLVPRLGQEDEFEPTVLAAVPKERGRSANAWKCDAWFRFLKPLGGGVDFGASVHKHLSRSAGEDNVRQFHYSVPECGDLPAQDTKQGGGACGWVDIHGLRQLLWNGHLHGPPDLFNPQVYASDCVQRLEYIRGRIADVCADASTGGSVLREAFDSSLDELPDLVDLTDGASTASGSVRTMRKPTVVWHAKFVLTHIKLLTSLMVSIGAILGQGRRSVAKRLNATHERVDDQEQQRRRVAIIQGCGLDPDCEEARAFKPARGVVGPMSLADFEREVDRGVRDIAGPGFSQSPGLFSTLMCIFDSSGSSASSGSGEHGRDDHKWWVRTLLENIMSASHPRLSFVYGPMLRGYERLRGAANKVLDVTRRLSGAGSSRARADTFIKDRVVSHAHGVWSYLVRHRRVLLSADNFVRTCVIMRRLGTHGAYLLGDYTSFIVTWLRETRWPADVKGAAAALNVPIECCPRCVLHPLRAPGKVSIDHAAPALVFTGSAAVRASRPCTQGTCTWVVTVDDTCKDVVVGICTVGMVCQGKCEDGIDTVGTAPSSWGVRLRDGQFLSEGRATGQGRGAFSGRVTVQFNVTQMQLTVTAGAQPAVNFSLPAVQGSDAPGLGFFWCMSASVGTVRHDNLGVQPASAGGPAVARCFRCTGLGLGIDVTGQGAASIKQRLRHRVIAPLSPEPDGEPGYELEVSGNILKSTLACLTECVARAAGADEEGVRIDKDAPMEVDGGAGTRAAVSVAGGSCILTLSGLNEQLSARGLRQACSLVQTGASGASPVYEVTLPYSHSALSRPLLGTAAADCASALATSTYALFGVESATAAHHQGAQDNSTHDPSLTARGFSGMQDTHVLGLLAVSSNTWQGMLLFLLIIRLHPILGRHLDHFETGLLCDIKLFKTLLRLWWDTSVDPYMLSLLWPIGLNMQLGIGLHMYKKLTDRTVAAFSGFLRQLYEPLVGAAVANSGQWFSKMKLSKQLYFLGSCLRAYTNQGGQQQLHNLLGLYPEDATLQSMLLLFEFYVPLAFLTFAVVRLSSSSASDDIRRAVHVLLDEVLPQLIVAFRQLGSHDYAKMTLLYLLMLDDWRRHRPDMWESFLSSGAKHVNEEPIELVHAFVALHFVCVQMARSDYAQSQLAFAARGPMLILQEMFRELCNVAPKDADKSDKVSMDMDKDAYLVGIAMDALLCNLEAGCVARHAIRLTQEAASRLSIWDPCVGCITPKMLKAPCIFTLIDEVARGAVRDMRSNTNGVEVTKTLSTYIREFYDPTSQRWKYQALSTLDTHFGGAWVTTSSGATRKIERRATGTGVTRRWAIRGPAPLIDIVSFMDMEDLISQLSSRVPQPANLVRRKPRTPKEVRRSERREGLFDGYWDGDLFVPPGREGRAGGDESTDDEVDSGSDDEASDDCMIEVTDARTTYRDMLGFEGPLQGVPVRIGIRPTETAKALLKAAKTSALQSRRTPTESEQAILTVTGATCGMDFSCALTHEEQQHMAPELLVAEKLHEYVAAKIAVQYEAAIGALAEGGCNAARARAILAQRNRGHPHARDMHSAFTNSALTSIIVATATIMHGAKIANSVPVLTPEIAAVAKHHMREADGMLSELSTSTDTDGKPLITATTGSDAGTAIRENIASLRQAAKSMVASIDSAYALQRGSTATGGRVLDTSANVRGRIAQSAAARMV